MIEQIQFHIVFKLVGLFTGNVKVFTLNPGKKIPNYAIEQSRIQTPR